MLRRWIAGVVVVFSLLLLNGARYEGPQRPATSIALGAFSGVLVGATGIGGPPIILYLLSGPDRPRSPAPTLRCAWWRYA